MKLSSSFAQASIKLPGRQTVVEPLHVQLCVCLKLRVKEIGLRQNLIVHRWRWWMRGRLRPSWRTPLGFYARRVWGTSRVWPWRACWESHWMSSMCSSSISTRQLKTTDWRKVCYVYFTSKGGGGPNSFIFVQFSAKKLQNNHNFEIGVTVSPMFISTNQFYASNLPGFITRWVDKSFCKLKHHHSIEKRENEYIVIQKHRTFKHSMTLLHFIVSLPTWHHFILSVY